jgi:hypothetical protein
MSKNKMIFALAGFAIVAATAIPAQADPPLAGTCQGEGWILVRVNESEDPKEAREVDKAGNHDQRVCDNQGEGNNPPKDNDQPL